MSDKVLMTLIVCSTVLLSILMIRSALNRLIAAKREDFSFLLRVWGAEFGLYRGNHRPPQSVQKSRIGSPKEQIEIEENLK